jgi:hypothetical protein
MPDQPKRTAFGLALKELRETRFNERIEQLCERFRAMKKPVRFQTWSKYEHNKLPSPQQLMEILDCLGLPRPGEAGYAGDRTRADLCVLYAIERVAGVLPTGGAMHDCLGAESRALFERLAERLGLSPPISRMPNITVKELIRQHITKDEVQKVWVAARVTMVERGVAIDEVLEVAIHKPYVYFLRNRAQAEDVALKLWDRARRAPYTDEQRIAIYDNLSFYEAKNAVAGFAEVTSMQILSSGGCIRYVRDSATKDVNSRCYREMEDPIAAALMLSDLRDCQEKRETIQTLLGVPRPTVNLPPITVRHPSTLLPAMQERIVVNPGGGATYSAFTKENEGLSDPPSSRRKGKGRASDAGE